MILTITSVVSVVANELTKSNEHVLTYAWKVFNDIHSGVCET